ncbi:MAG: hypothetical protein ACM3JG_05735 [Thiohalocapsa sp.]
MSVALRRPGTGEIKVLQDGWSWGCCLGCGLLGLPLFRRGLQVWGAAMVVFNIVALIVGLVPTQRASSLYGWMILVWIGACLFFGARANAMAIDHHLAMGWEYADRRRQRFSL